MFQTMRIKVLFIFISLLVACPTHGQDSYVSPKIEEYVDFINDCNTSPVDYVMGLFDRYDIVILGERDHRDTTQYDLIEQIMSDPRFIDQVGLIMTEVGVYNMTGTVDCIVNASYASDREFETALWDAYQNLDYTPLWENTNFHQYLCSVYRINKRLPTEKKLHISCTDVPFSWHQTEGLTHEQFQDFLHIWDYKDIVMGNNALTELYKLFDGPDPRKKALIIFNSPHSFLTGPNSRPAPYAGQIIAERFPGRVANVAINWAKRRNGYRGLTQNGKWDAAFAACGNKSIGFDLAGTPFGEDRFDLRPGYFKKRLEYKEVYTGFIFYKPVGEWVFGIGIPNMADAGFVDELVRRDSEIWSGETMSSPEERSEIYDYYARIRSFRIPDLSGQTSFIEKIDRQISRYYKPGVRKGGKQSRKNQKS